MDNYVWPDCSYSAVDMSLCYHSRQYLKSLKLFDDRLYMKIPYVVNTLERMYAATKVRWGGMPTDWNSFICHNIDWTSTPGWPWKKQFPTNKDLFEFDGIRCSDERVEMVKMAVLNRWTNLLHFPLADPIYTFIKQEPHKRTKADKRAWRLISGVGLTDSLIDRILYGEWLDNLIDKWDEIPSKAGWAPYKNGFRWLTRAFRNKQPVSIDKSSWDWTVNDWHVKVLVSLIPRMLFDIDEVWRDVFGSRMQALFGSGFPEFKFGCECTFTQQVDGIMKSGCLGTIGFNSILQVADHLAADGSEEDLIFSMGDDTVQEMPYDLEGYISKLRKTGAVIKEVDVGWPIAFAGTHMSEDSSIPAYKSKHMFALLHLDDRYGKETLESYRHQYALDPKVSIFLEKLALDLYGPSNLMSREYLRDWYMAIDQ